MSKARDEISPVAARYASRMPLRAIQLAGVALLGITLTACSTVRPTQKAFAPDEYDVRHPIKLQDQVTHLDIFPNGNHLDRRQQQDVAEFAKDFLRYGRSGMTAAVPQGPAGHAAMSAVRAALAAGGAHGGIQIAPYATDPALGAAPIRLSFVKLQAKVDSKCGLWPDDLAGSKDADTWQNRPYHNLGCAYQSMIAAQVADPIDLVRPRTEGPIDVGKRTKDIEGLRKGEDPATKWAKDDVKIKDATQ